MRKFLAATLVTAALAAPAFAEVHVGINIPAPPSIVINSPPRLVVVPGVPTVQYAPDLGFNFFVHDNAYYTYHNGGWFTATSYGGPWSYVERVHVPGPIIGVPNRYYYHGGRRWHGDRHSYRGHVKHYRTSAHVHSRGHHRGHDDR